MSGAFFLLLCSTSTGSGDNGTLHFIRETGGKLEKINAEEDEEITLRMISVQLKKSITKSVGVQPHTNGQTEIIIL